MKRSGPKTEPCGTLQVRGDEGELCEGIHTVDVRDEIYEVNHCSESKGNAKPGEKTAEPN